MGNIFAYNYSVILLKIEAGVQLISGWAEMQNLYTLIKGKSNSEMAVRRQYLFATFSSDRRSATSRKRVHLRKC